MGITLTPGQEAFCRVAYDGEPVTNEIQRSIFRGSPKGRTKTVNVAAGRGSGKSYIFLAVRMIHGALVRDLSSLSPGEVATSLLVAPDMRLVTIPLNFIRGALESKPELKAMIRMEDRHSITIERPDGYPIRFEGLPATRGGSALRGRPFTDVGLEEAAFFRGEDYAVNDQEIYRAVLPRLLPGGQVVIGSSPWAESGILYELDKTGCNEHVTAARAPTLVMNDSPGNRETAEAERKRDPENARREIDVEFMSNMTGQFFDSNAIKGAVQSYELETCKRNSRYRYSCGVDLGFKSDSSALVVVEFDGETYRTVAMDELRPSPEAPLQPSEVVARFAGIAREFGCTHVISDGHYREAIAEHLQTHSLGLINAPAGQVGKQESYARARAVLHEGRCVLPDHPRLTSQLRSVVSKPTTGGGLSISSPRKPGGGHGDLVSAWVLAVHHLASAKVATLKQQPPPYGTREYEMFLAIKSEKEMMEEDMRKYGSKGNDDW